MPVVADRNEETSSRSEPGRFPQVNSFRAGRIPLRSGLPRIAMRGGRYGVEAT
ncbi:hypothetical protein HMPREF0972_00538 [Actinomyces sp. oral taxon 848 str. F0332]|nr:hypothetical protein HMPREF0972_00538 [Actinomyces sp. oral taxon 848 str. F0332]